MGEDPGAVRAPVTDQRTTPAHTPDDPAALRAEIERTRLELGETVAALAEKTDVKARAKEKVAEVKETVTRKKSELVSQTRNGSADRSGSATGSAMEQVRAKAQEKPVHTAAMAAFAGGFLLGRITAR